MTRREEIVCDIVEDVLPIALGGHTLKALEMIDHELSYDRYDIPPRTRGWRETFARMIGLTANDLRRKDWHEKHLHDLETGRKYADHEALLTAYAMALFSFRDCQLNLATAA